VSPFQGLVLGTMLDVAPQAHSSLATRSEIAFHLGKRYLIFNELPDTSLAVAQTARDLATEMPSDERNHGVTQEHAVWNAVAFEPV